MEMGLSAGLQHRDNPAAPGAQTERKTRGDKKNGNTEALASSVRPLARQSSRETITNKRLGVVERKTRNIG